MTSDYKVVAIFRKLKSLSLVFGEIFTHGGVTPPNWHRYLSKIGKKTITYLIQKRFAKFKMSVYKKAHIKLIKKTQENFSQNLRTPNPTVV